MFLHAIEAVGKARAKARGDEKQGMDILIEALKVPTMQIVANAGADGAIVVDEILNAGDNIGYDAAKGKYVDMVAAGIIDPAKVSRSALQNAARIAALLLTTDLLVTDLDEKEDAIPGAVT